MSTGKVKKLVESAVMIALATALSLIKIIDLPYGGSVTIASMLPIAVISYRHGLGWGFASGTVHGLIQQLLGLKTLSYFTSWQSIIAVIFLDYLLAFSVAGIAGIFRKAIKNQAAALTFGALLACVLRYAMHVVSGATVWSGLSIPTQAALSYSLIYNATYMIPETIITALCAFYVGSAISLSAETPVRIKRAGTSGAPWLVPVSLMLVVAAVVFDVCAVFSHLQDPETGAFTLSNTANINMTAIYAVSIIAFTAAFIMLSVRCVLKSGNKRVSAAMSIIFNVLIIVLTFYSVHYYFRSDIIRDSADLTVPYFLSLRHFTTLSNIHAAIAALIVIFFTLRNYSQNSYDLPKWVMIVKHSAAVSVSVTFFTVALFLAPIVASTGKGYFYLFGGNQFCLHFLTPVLAMASVIFFENSEGFKSKHAVFGLAPVVLYSIIYFLMVVVVKAWPDFYGFSFGGKAWTIPISAVVMAGVTYGLSAAEYALQKLFARSSKLSG